MKSSYGTNLALPYSGYDQFAKFYLQKGDLVNAKVIGQNMIEQYPDDDESYALVGEILLKQGDKTAALRYYKLAQAKAESGKYLKEIADIESREK